MVKKSVISTLLAVVLVFTAGCSPIFSPEGTVADKFLSADITGNSGTYQGGLSSLNGTAVPTDALETPGTSSDGSPAAREIEEADMVKLIDHTLYVLNSYRGLKIIDVTDWSKPVMKGAFGFLGSPVEMYVTNGIATIVVLNDGLCRLDGLAQVVKQTGTTVYLVDVSNAEAPRQINSFGIDGFVKETRRVGDVVYLAGAAATTTATTSETDVASSIGYWQSTDGFVASVYVADPLKVALVDQKTFAGQGQYIHATQTAMFVSGMNWETGVSKIQYVDISDPAGTIALRGSCEVPGQILDRFAMNANENVLRVVADKQQWVGLPMLEDQMTQLAKEEEPKYGVKLFTFDLSNPDDIKQLGSLFIIKNETVRAVRFDGLKGYVVTFEQRDPLWVIDLANVAEPKITGYLEAPGYSTYLEADGNRLVAVGLDDTDTWRACVMLYDVSDVANPKELDREILGEEYSSSEANYDDKAFTVIPEADLILVPYDTWKDGYKNKLAMIDYSGDTLTNLAQIDHRGTAVRSGVDLAANVLWVLSQNALQTLNIADRQSPRQLAMMTLAENVLAYKPFGQYGLRLVSLSENWSEPAYELQAVNGNDPNGSEVLSRLSITVNYPQLILVDDSLAVISGETKGGKLKLSAINISTLPGLALAGEKEFDFSTYGGGYYPLEATYYKARAKGGFAPPWTSFIMPIWYGGGQGGPYLLENKNLVYITWDSSDGNNSNYVLKAISFADPADIKVTGEVKVQQTNNQMVMQAGVSGNKIYQSIIKYRPLSFFEQVLGTNNDKPVAPFYLRLIDFNDPANPQVGELRNVPGLVAGIQGETVFTFDPQWTDDGIATSFCSVRLSNVSAEVMSKVELPEGDPGTVVFANGAAVMTVGQSYWWGGPVYAETTTAKDDECQMGNFRIVSIRVADPYNLAKMTDSEYPGCATLAGAAGGFVIGQLSYPNQALIWQIADDKSLVSKTVTDLPGYITDLSVSNNLVNLVCGYGGILQVNPNP